MDKKIEEDIKLLLYKGFLPLKMQIGNVSIVFKTLNQNEYDRILLMCGLNTDSRYSIYYHLYFLYFSILMIDGVNFLDKREELFMDFILE